MSITKLKQSYELVSLESKRDRCELRDSARGGLVVYRGTYKQVYAEAKRRGLTYGS